ncbi:protein-tyrosine phosphatase family protein [Verrucosispora sp. TAA-831]|uniref:protein-tyrosine phosphatase family protein n=1 Tax=Verrucosispora sp. TAA-831 TaxID=3422227 RepID=UPI003D6E0756
MVVTDEFDLVISLYRRSGSGPAEGVEHHYLNIPDGMLLPADAVRCAELASIAAAAVGAGRRTLIRCQAGYNRSGLVAALTLIRLGHTAGEAIALIQAKRSPYALFNGHFVNHLLNEGDPAPAADLTRTPKE